MDGFKKKKQEKVTYLLLVGCQIPMDLLRLQEGGASMHGKANVQHSVLRIHQAKDVDIIRRNGEHL